MNLIEKFFEINPEEGCIFDGVDEIKIYSSQKSTFVLNFSMGSVKPDGESGVIKFNIKFSDDINDISNLVCNLVVNNVLLDLRVPFLNNNENIIIISPIHEGRLHVLLNFNFSDANEREIQMPITLSHIQYTSILDSPNDDAIRIIRSGYDIAFDQGLVGADLIKKINDTYNLIINALDNNTPLSIIRLGDGEGRILGCPSFFSEIDVLYQVFLYQFGQQSIETARNLFGENWLITSISKLRGMLVHAMHTADVIGLPITQFYDNYNNYPTFGHLGYAAASLSYSGKASQKLVTDRIVGVNVFQYLASESDYIERLLKKAKTVYIVGPWNLTIALKENFSLLDVQYIDVAPHATWGSLIGEGGFPRQYKQTLEKIAGLTIGSQSLFLIGAGVLGKYYCSFIKSKGGIALDIGSVFDSWANKGLPYAIQNEVKEIV